LFALGSDFAASCYIPGMGVGQCKKTEKNGFGREIVALRGFMLTDKEIYTNKDFVGMAVSGEVDHSRAITIARRYVNLAYQYPRHNILVDLRDVKASIDITSLMEITQEAVGRFPDFRNKVAHLIYDESERVRIAKQLESCMVLKGVNYKVFTDFKVASDWLSKAS
jgi:hypothetical protein